MAGNMTLAGKQRVQKLGFAVEERYTPCTG